MPQFRGESYLVFLFSITIATTWYYLQEKSFVFSLTYLNDVILSFVPFGRSLRDSVTSSSTSSHWARGLNLYPISHDMYKWELNPLPNWNINLFNSLTPHFSLTSFCILSVTCQLRTTSRHYSPPRYSPLCPDQLTKQGAPFSRSSASAPSLPLTAPSNPPPNHAAGFTIATFTLTCALHQQSDGPGGEVVSRFRS
jgi:hypothetical protein